MVPIFSFPQLCRGKGTITIEKDSLPYNYRYNEISFCSSKGQMYEPYVKNQTPKPFLLLLLMFKKIVIGFLYCLTLDRVLFLLV